MSSDSLSACSLNSFVYLFIFFTPYIIGCFGTALLLYLSTGWKAISGLCILASIFVVNIVYMTTQFQGNKSLLPGKIALECMGEMFFRIDENCNKRLFSKEDRSEEHTSELQS